MKINLRSDIYHTLLLEAQKNGLSLPKLVHLLLENHVATVSTVSTYGENSGNKNK
ncbi:hypothetical protein [Sodalis sp. RH19]|uniref:hypothetical protein n=1 Tax=Sodalis sp. RH19 TaxID=3394334 RepID=UPI0039B3C3C5